MNNYAFNIHHIKFETFESKGRGVCEATDRAVLHTRAGKMRQPLPITIHVGALVISDKQGVLPISVVTNSCSLVETCEDNF